MIDYAAAKQDKVQGTAEEKEAAGKRFADINHGEARSRPLSLAILVVTNKGLSERQSRHNGPSKTTKRYNKGLRSKAFWCSRWIAPFPRLLTGPVYQCTRYA
jgi:hypothetical protein